MNKTFQILSILSALVILSLIALMSTVQAGAVVWLLAGREDGDDAYEAAPDYSWLASSRFDDYIDEQIDAGMHDIPPIDTDPLLKQRKILISHSINSRSARDVVAKLFYLNREDPSSPIDLYITTQGGYTDSMFTIIDAIRLVDAPVNTWAVGGCHSAGAAILCSGTGRRYATENTIIMVHTNFNESYGSRKSLVRVWRMFGCAPPGLMR